MLKRIGAEESGEFKAVASGTLPCGRPVVVNADGTVSVVAETSVSAGVGTKVVFENASTYRTSAVYDSNAQKVVIAYADYGGSLNGDGTAIVGTVSGTSISFGSPVTFSSDDAQQIATTFDSTNNKVVIAFRDGSNSSYGTAIVGTVSGTSISFGSATVYNSNTTTHNSAAFDSNAGKVVIGFRNQTGSNLGKAIVGTVSGTSISFGSAVTFNNASTQRTAAVYDSNAQKVVISYRDLGDSNKGKSIVGTVSGTSISFGSAVEFNSDTNYIKSTYDSTNNKVIVVYADSGNGNNGTAIVGTVSGTSISFGSEVVFHSGLVYESTVNYDSSANKSVVAYRSSSTDSGKIRVGTVSGTSISFDSEAEFESNTVNELSGVYDSSEEKIVLAYRDAGNSSYGTAIVFRNSGTSPNLTSENYIGMSRGIVGKLQAETQAVGTAATHYTTAAVAYNSAVFDNNSNKVVFSFRGNGDDGTSIVGTVDSSNNSMSFGSPVVWNTDESIYVRSAFDSNLNKVVVVYRDNGNNDVGTAVVGTVSGTSISFGTAVVFSGGGAVDHIDVTFDSSNSKVVIAYRDRNASFQAKAIVGTVSGTSISFGSAVIFNTGTTNIYMNTAFDSNSNKVVVGWGNPGKAKVGTVSGTSISFGSEATFESGNLDHFSSAFDSSNNKVVYAYRDEGNSNYGTAVVGTVSGTSISFGTPVVFESATVSGTGTIFDTNANKINIFYDDGGNSNYGTVVVGTVSGTSISFGTPVVFEAASSSQFGATFDSNSNRAVIAYTDSGNSGYGTHVVFKNAGNYPVTGQVTNGQAASIDIIGSVSTNQSSLTAGQQYFVQTDGTIGTTAGSPSVLAGTAISATELVVKT